MQHTLTPKGLANMGAGVGAGLRGAGSYGAGAGLEMRTVCWKLRGSLLSFFRHGVYFIKNGPRSMLE